MNSELRPVLDFPGGTTADRMVRTMQSLFVTGTHKRASDVLHDARMTIANALGALAPRAGLRGALSPGVPLATGGRCTAYPYAFLDRDRWPDTFILLSAAEARVRPSISTVDFETPLGRIAGDRRVARQIAARSWPRLDLDGTLLATRSWQDDLLLLHAVAGELDRSLCAVVIVAGPMRHPTARRLGRALSEVLFAQRKRGCLIVTGGPRIGQRMLEAIAAGRCDELVAADGPKPSLRSHASALIEFAQTDGVILGHEVVGSRKAASIAFTLGRPVVEGRAAQALRACDHILLLGARGRSPARLLHLCDHRAHELGGGSQDVMRELLRGVSSIAELAQRLSSRWATEVTTADVVDLIDAIGGAGLLHAHEPPAPTPSWFVRARAAAMLARARAEVPFYRQLASPTLESAPLLFPADVRARWHELFRAGVAWRGPTPAARKRFYVRASSASSGDQIKTVVELDVMRERLLGWTLVAERPDGPVVAINRPANFSMPDPVSRWPCARRLGATLRLSPGPNPTEVSPEIWNRTLDAVVAADPQRITGDPAYVAGLARCALRRGIRLARLEVVEMAHSFAWEIYQDAARRAFAVPVTLEYDASEIGPIAVTCRDGQLHLLEAHMHYELLDRGLPIGEGALGEIVVTTLDTTLRPLIRYVLGDVVRLRASACRCGRPFRVIEYEGRVRNLLTGPDGQPVTYRTLDRAIGAPPGVDFFRVNARRRGHATLEVVPSTARDLVDIQPLADAIGACLGRSVRVAWRTSLSVRPGGKLLAIDTDDASRAWHRRFLAMAPSLRSYAR